MSRNILRHLLKTWERNPVHRGLSITSTPKRRTWRIWPINSFLVSGGLRKLSQQMYGQEEYESLQEDLERRNLKGTNTRSTGQRLGIATPRISGTDATTNPPRKT